MIEFYAETDFELTDSKQIAEWITNTIIEEGYKVGELVYVFCDDQYLHKLNVQFLNHDTLTDIISFDNSLGKQINGEIYISIERVKENADHYNVSFKNELHRVIIHGILHYCGYKDKTEDEASLMRIKENEALKKRPFL
ncbi:rRNA maturation RNase YbeY [Marixanthomonas spongiae]|uniref:Endoribonuclease YbeY n=1 Tax=Marixanthomonas spongiae TaxID=2174845 RepID=A0A2U0I233_9FLAO|nr:rRNA maturation RNase YbeY [Marixanthomonas spongiae]PVW15158.1 rRNA maturation RNase YbeY [Marixanthomonas spongiae]